MRLHLAGPHGLRRQAELGRRDDEIGSARGPRARTQMGTGLLRRSTTSGSRHPVPVTYAGGARADGESRDPSPEPAGLLVRRGHRQALGFWSLPSTRRPYGLWLTAPDGSGAHPRPAGPLAVRVGERRDFRQSPDSRLDGRSFSIRTQRSHDIPARQRTPRTTSSHRGGDATNWPVKPTTVLGQGRRPVFLDGTRVVLLVAAIALANTPCAAANGVDLLRRSGIPGQRIDVTGHRWLTCCPTRTPVEHVELFLVTSSKSIRLFDVSANDAGEINAFFIVPHLGPGRYGMKACGRGPNLPQVTPGRTCLPEGSFRIEATAPRSRPQEQRSGERGAPGGTSLLARVVIAAGGLTGLLVAVEALRRRWWTRSTPARLRKKNQGRGSF